MMCGTPVAAAREEQRPRRAHGGDPETLRFLRAIISRPATFTFVFLIANVFLYLLMYLSGGATDGVLVAYGAKVNDLIKAGQWWRFVTPIFLHVQLVELGPLLAHLHLLSNMYGLFMLGPYVEKLYGSARFVFFWVLTGVAGVVASYFAVRPEWARGVLGEFLFKPNAAPSAGASGAPIDPAASPIPASLRASCVNGSSRARRTAAQQPRTAPRSASPRRTSADTSRVVVEVERVRRPPAPRRLLSTDRHVPRERLLENALASRQSR